MLKGLCMRRFVLEDLMYWPVGFRTMFCIIGKVSQAKEGNTTYDIAPLALMEGEIEAGVEQKWRLMEKWVAERHHHVLASLPAWHQGVDQTDASWGEQVGALVCITKRLDVLQVLLQTVHGRAVWHGRQFVRPLYIDGPPGTGKTFIGLHAMGLVASKVCSSDMQWEITAVSAQRAAVLGGEHIHALFWFVPGRSCFYSSYQQLAATSLAHLQRHPEKKRRLHQPEVLFIDEMCQVGCPLLLAIDAVFQKVKGNDMPFGGVFVLGAGDHYQNEPTNEMPPLQSRFVLVHFDVLSLKELFRSRNDPLLQQLIGKMRVAKIRARDVEWVLHMLQCDEKDCHCNQRERDHCHHNGGCKGCPTGCHLVVAQEGCGQ